MEEDRKSVVKAWLFLLLSQVESSAIKDAKLTESGDTTTVAIQFERGKKL